MKRGSLINKKAKEWLKNDGDKRKKGCIVTRKKRLDGRIVLQDQAQSSRPAVMKHTRC